MASARDTVITQADVLLVRSAVEQDDKDQALLLLDIMMSNTECDDCAT
jgi:hypothetical protein